MATKKDAKASEFFQRYMALAKGDDLIQSLQKNTVVFKKLLKKIPKKKVDFAYAPGKWTLRDMLRHIIDAERVFTYRALHLARRDAHPLPGFDENQWAVSAHPNNKSWKELQEEFKTVRKATGLLFESFSDEQLLATGIAGEHEINVVALGFICSGHAEHHINIIKERYL